MCYIPSMMRQHSNCPAHAFHENQTSVFEVPTYFILFSRALGYSIGNIQRENFAKKWASNKTLSAYLPSRASEVIPKLLPVIEGLGSRVDVHFLLTWYLSPHPCHHAMSHIYAISSRVSNRHLTSFLFVWIKSDARPSINETGPQKPGREST